MSASSWLDACPLERARAALTRCCGARRWVAGMLAARPFGDDRTLHAKSELLWWQLDEDDWHEAFSHHPRIGDRRLDQRAFDTVRDLSQREQRAALEAPDDVRRALDDGNARYEQHFGHVFLICARGLPPAAILRALEARMQNDPTTELRIAAAEQAKITRLRLDELTPSPAEPTGAPS